MQIRFEMLDKPRKGYSVLELMACVMARHLRDGEMAGTGAGSAVARAACRLAQLTHAPNLSFVAGGSGAINPLLDPLVPSSCDYTNFVCESVYSMPDLISSVTGGGCDVFFCGGLQVDKYGNLNLSVIGEYNKPKLRGPGSAALPLFAYAKRTVIFMGDHSLRSFVEKVDFRTSPGFLEGGESWRTAKEEGLILGEGPVLVVSPLGVFDFEEESKAMRLVSVHPGKTLEEVVAATGFQLVVPAEVPTTSPPTEKELVILRSLDTDGILK
jgi:glutaconate CoA-transferase subunit B